MSRTDEEIARIRTLVQSGKLPPGAKLPPEQQLAAESGISRSPMREAVKALAGARVLDVRRGDGTYVTSLAPAVLLDGLGLAVELMQGNTLLELTEVRPHPHRTRGDLRHPRPGGGPRAHQHHRAPAAPSPRRGTRWQRRRTRRAGRFMKAAR